MISDRAEPQDSNTLWKGIIGLYPSGPQYGGEEDFWSDDSLKIHLKRCRIKPDLPGIYNV